MYLNKTVMSKWCQSEVKKCVKPENVEAKEKTTAPIKVNGLIRH